MLYDFCLTVNTCKSHTVQTKQLTEVLLTLKAQGEFAAPAQVLLSRWVCKSLLLIRILWGLQNQNTANLLSH